MPAPAPTQAVLGDERSQVIEILVRKGRLAREAIEAARAACPGKPVLEALVDQKALTRADVLAAQAAVVGVPFVIISPRMVQAEALKALPPAFCEKHNLLPLQLADDWLTVAVERFADLFLAEEIAHAAGRKVQVVAAPGDNIRDMRSRLMQELAVESPSDGGDLKLDQRDLDELTVLSSGAADKDEARDLESAAAGSPIVKLVNHIVTTAVQLRASDIHIEPTEREFRIRYRIDGDLSADSLRPSIRLLPAVVSRIKIMASMDIAERRLPQDGRVTVAVGERAAELRISTMATPLGEKVVIRIADTSTGLRRLDEQGFAPGLLAGFRAVLREPHGLILVTGPTGSGKSTTLYAALSELVSERVNISTVEDPVERRIEGINQFQANAKAGFTFAKALRSLLRQDPDIVMIGEIRDAETAKLATEAALTGHLVLATLHTNDAPTAVPRLVNMGVEPYLVAASLRAVLAQRLVGKVCPQCRQPAHLAAAVTASLGKLFPEEPPLADVHRGAGCAKCRDTGLSGRIAVHELLLLSEEALESFGSELSLKTMRQFALKSSTYRSLAHDCLAKARQGLVPVEAVLDLAGGAGTVESPAPVAEAA